MQIPQVMQLSGMRYIPIFVHTLAIIIHVKKVLISWTKPEAHRHLSYEKNKQNGLCLLKLSEVGDHPWQQPENIECNHNCLLMLSQVGEHPLQQPEFIEGSSGCTVKCNLELSKVSEASFSTAWVHRTYLLVHQQMLAWKGQHHNQLPEQQEKTNKKNKELIAQGKHYFQTEESKMRHVTMIYNETKSTHWIDVYDKTGTKRRLFPKTAFLSNRSKRIQSN